MSEGDVKAIAARLEAGYCGWCGCEDEEANADVRSLLQDRAALVAVAEAARVLLAGLQDNILDATFGYSKDDSAILEYMVEEVGDLVKAYKAALDAKPDAPGAKPDAG